MKSKRALLAFIVFTCFFGCQSRDSTTVPGELVGVWKTSAPKYKGCYFELTQDSIIFANIPLSAKNNNSVSKIEKIHRKGKPILYTIHYEDREGLEYKFSFFYDPLRGGTIRLKTQRQIVWKKVH